MNDTSTEDKLRDYLKRVTAELSQTRQQLREAQESARDPIAIVGMACRYPGAQSPEELWDLVTAGRVTVTDFPQDRGWDLDAIYDPTGQAPNTCHARQAGFLSDVAGFDAGFFGLSDREALVMDPQQRIMLEIAWEALERARIDPTSLRGTNSSVFNGVVAQQYGPRIDQADEQLKDHLLAGNTNGFVSGRIAYSLGLQGAALTVDSTSSSSMMALQLATRALRGGDCDLALAGGVSILSTPSHFIEYSRTKLLSPTGRARSFDERADGINFAEGAGMLVLERLSDARRKGRRILGVIRGAATAHNGTSNGLSTTNTPAVERLIHRGLADARLTASDIDIIECHDPGYAMSGAIEARALQNVYGPGRSDDAPLYVGTIKGSFGHSAAAAGVGCVIKMVMALHNKVLPKMVVDTPTSDVDWDKHPVKLITENKPWPGGNRVRRAAINSFGLNGTNGHLIVEEAPRELDTAHAAAEPWGLAAPITPWPVSAKSPQALRGQAAKLLSHLETHPDLEATDVGYSLATTRAPYDSRAVVLAADRDGFARGLRALAEGEHAAELVRGDVAEANLAFAFAGPPGKHADRGRLLYRHSPVFAATVDGVATELDPYLDRSLSDVAFGADPGMPDEQPYLAAATFAMGIGLFRMCETWGLNPEFVVGRSTGAAAAAYAAGAVTAEEACALLFKTPQQSREVSAFSCFHRREVPVSQLKESGIDTFMGAHPEGGIDLGVDGAGATEFIPMLRPDVNEASSVAIALAEAHVVGFPVDWGAYFAGSGARRVDLPTYAFQRRRYWLEPGTTRLSQTDFA